MSCKSALAGVRIAAVLGCVLTACQPQQAVDPTTSSTQVATTASSTMAPSTTEAARVEVAVLETEEELRELFDETTFDIEDAALLDVLWQVMLATAPYQDVSRAMADGFRHPGDGCFDDAGIHYWIVARFDEEIDPLSPEALMYEPAGDGGLRLVAVEYFVPAQPFQNPPEILGREARGPLFIPAVGQQIFWHHVWLWKKSPEGLFAPWNEDVDC